jgi:hypothetical protein
VTKFLGLLILAALVVKFWPWIVGAVVLWLLVRAVLRAGDRVEEQQAESARRAADLLGRCDREHALWMRGDDRGFYGQYPPDQAAAPGHSEGARKSAV